MEGTRFSSHCEPDEVHFRLQDFELVNECLEICPVFVTHFLVPVVVSIFVRDLCDIALLAGMILGDRTVL